MLQTALLEPFLVQKTEEQNREETVKDCIDKIRPLNDDLINCIEYKNKSFTQKIKEERILLFWFSILLIAILGYFINLMCLSLTENFLGSMMGFVFILFLNYLIVKEDHYVEKELINKEEENKKNIITLFSSLSDKKFEIRGELLENCSKLKLIVEENQYIDGTTSVIKNSSKSLTAYINMTESKEFIIKSIVSVVKESERKFS